MNKQPEVIDQLVEFDEDHTDSAAGPQLTIRRYQDIPDEHVATLKRDKIDPDHQRMGDFVRFASIPLSVVEMWDRQGFRIEEHSVHEIVQKLHREGLDAFVTTNKRV